MIQSKEVQAQSTVRVYSFFCDDCGAFLGESTEYPDGYYEHKGEYEHSVYIGNAWWHRKATLCDACRDKEVAAVSESLILRGYREADR